MTEKEILQQQESNGQTAFYLMAVGMFYHAYGCGAFALSRATGYRVLSMPRGQVDDTSALESEIDRLVYPLGLPLG